MYTCVFFYKVQLQLQGKLGLNSELKLTLSIASNLVCWIKTISSIIFITYFPPVKVSMHLLCGWVVFLLMKHLAVVRVHEKNHVFRREPGTILCNCNVAHSVYGNVASLW